MQRKNTATTEEIAKKDNSYGYISGSKIVSVNPSDDVEIFYISDDVWNKKREEIRNKFKKKI